MKIHQYNEMMRWLTRPKVDPRDAQLAASVQYGTQETYGAPEETPMPNWRDLIREEGVQVGPQVKDGGRVGMKPGGLVEPGVTHYGQLVQPGPQRQGFYKKGFVEKGDKIKTVLNKIPVGGPVNLTEVAREVGVRRINKEHPLIKERKLKLVSQVEKNRLITSFLEEQIKTGKIKGKTGIDLAKEFNLKYPDKKFFFGGRETFVDHKAINNIIQGNPDLKKKIKLTPGRIQEPAYQKKLDKAVEAYKNLPDSKKRAMRTGGVGHTGELDKFMEKYGLFRSGESKYKQKTSIPGADQKKIDRAAFNKARYRAGVTPPDPLSEHEGKRKMKAKRMKTIGEIGSTTYESHLDDYKRALQRHIGVKPTTLTTGKKMLPLDLAHRTDIDQLAKFGVKLDPSDLGLDYYKMNREGVAKTKEGVKSLENKLTRLYRDQITLYKKAKKLKKIPESLSKEIFLNNDEILKAIDESQFKGRLKPITVNPATLKIKKGSVIVDDVTKQLGIGLIDKPMSEIEYSRTIQPGGQYSKATPTKHRKIGSIEDATIKINLGEQVIREADEAGLIKDKAKARKLANEFIGITKIDEKDLVKNLKDAEVPCIKGVGGQCNSVEDYRKGFNELVQRGAARDKAAVSKLQKFTNIMKKAKGPLKWTGYGLLAEVGFMIPFAAADYTKGESWKRIIGNATDWGFGPMFGQSEDEEIIANLPEGSLGAQQIKALETGERTERLETGPARGAMIGMDPKRYDLAQYQVKEAAEQDFRTAIKPFIVNGVFDTEAFTQAGGDLEAARAQIEKDKLTRIEERRESGFLAEEDWMKNLPVYRSTGGRVPFGKGKLVDEGRRAFMKWLAGITGAGVAAGTGLLKIVKGSKGVTTIKAGDHIIQGTKGMPDWFIPLINRIVKEGDDVTKKLGTVEREIVHTKSISKTEDVTVYQNLDTGNVRVEYGGPEFDKTGKIIRASNDPDVVYLEYKAPEVIESGKYKGKKTEPEFSAAESEPEVVNWDGDIEKSGINEVNKVEDLVTDTSKLKEFGTKKKLTHRDKVIAKKKQKYQNKLESDTMEQIEYIEKKRGPFQDPQPADDMFDEFGNYIGDD